MSRRIVFIQEDGALVDASTVKVIRYQDLSLEELEACVAPVARITSQNLLDVCSDMIVWSGSTYGQNLVRYYRKNGQPVEELPEERYQDSVTTEEQIPIKERHNLLDKFV
jgi:hypothetical protein